MVNVASILAFWSLMACSCVATGWYTLLWFRSGIQRDLAALKADQIRLRFEVRRLSEIIERIAPTDRPDPEKSRNRESPGRGN